MRKSVQIHVRNVFAMDEAIVRAKGSTEQEDLITTTGAAVDTVGLLIPFQDDRIVLFTAVDAIRAPGRKQQVGAAAAEHRVVATLASQAVMTTESSDPVSAPESTNPVVVGGSHEIVRPIRTDNDRRSG